ncbi:hypothetical protein F4692_001484 [Nocardioides cavernae]|uniref:Uncharacterized protein n=1 Tax=Nocardioides cavernae TaxID=1921566 RepID=A0A7Y9H1S2_9ACTN|nr:hypothetical protein [Nocardioides cavernae]
MSGVGHSAVVRDEWPLSGLLHRPIAADYSVGLAHRVGGRLPPAWYS